MSTLVDLQRFPKQLQETDTWYTLSFRREGALMVQLAVPGQRWEVEFFPDREPEIEVFKCQGDIFGPDKLKPFWALDGRNADVVFPPRLDISAEGLSSIHSRQPG